MRIILRKDEFSEVWDNVFYKKLSGYPDITDWEMRTLIEFVEYEKSYGRDCEIFCEDRVLLDTVQEKLKDPEKYRNVPRPARITECTACPFRKGCETAFVCHTTSEENAKSILLMGKLLSAVRARNMPAEALMAENRNVANDPADYFQHIMFAWGNCPAGDRLVMERKLGRFPDEMDLSVHFTPGIRFYFRYEELITHPNAVFDGVLPVKIRDELYLEDSLYAIVIPAYLKEKMEPLIPRKLVDKVIYLPCDCSDIWEWAEKVYCAIENFEK